MEHLILYKKKSESKWVVCVILRVEEMFAKSRTLLICTMILIPVFFIAMGVIAAESAVMMVTVIDDVE